MPSVRGRRGRPSPGHKDVHIQKIFHGKSERSSRTAPVIKVAVLRSSKDHRPCVRAAYFSGFARTSGSGDVCATAKVFGYCEPLFSCAGSNYTSFVLGYLQRDRCHRGMPYCLRLPPVNPCWVIPISPLATGLLLDITGDAAVDFRRVGKCLIGNEPLGRSLKP